MDDKTQHSAVDRYAKRGRVRHDDQRGEYKAFAADRAESGELEAVELRMLQYQGEVIYYSSITRFHHNSDVSVTLRGLDFLAVIEGKNLGRLIHLLKRRECDFVQAFDPHRFHEADDPDAPFVEVIRVHNLFEGTVAYGGNA